MKGKLLTYDSELRKDVSLLNIKLFARIVSVNAEKGKQYYYYRGILENNLLCRITNGCYFVTGVVPEINKMKIYEVDLEISLKELKTPREEIREEIVFRGIEVKNFE